MLAVDSRHFHVADHQVESLAAGALEPFAAIQKNVDAAGEDGFHAARLGNVCAEFSGVLFVFHNEDADGNGGALDSSFFTHGSHLWEDECGFQLHPQCQFRKAGAIY